MKREVIYSVKGPKCLPEMTWEEVAEALQETDLCIIPVGSVEEHGPHMPLATDTIQGVEIAQRIVAKLDDEGIKAIVGPPIPFGVNPEALDFAGSITLTPTTMLAVLREICESLIKHGFRKLVLLPVHAENLGVAYSCVQEISRLPDVRIIALNRLPQLRKHYPELLTNKEVVGGHGGEGETSMIMATFPELVVMERARSYIPPEGERLEFGEPFHMGGGVFDLPHGMKEVTPIGCFGDPLSAKPETGDKCLDHTATWAAKVIKKHFKLG
ncbi:MAG: creatininase family protein [Chloroflexi bacterium]|nr:creatininase family protein [Chloroflexota bacterium]